MPSMMPKRGRRRAGGPHDPLAGRKSGSEADRLEALEWLRKNRNKSPFATNRFSRKREAVAAVSEFYRSGAKHVRIDPTGVYKEPWRIKQEGGPYADTLLITPRPGKASEIKRTARDMSADEISTERGKVRVWWD